LSSPWSSSVFLHLQDTPPLGRRSGPLIRNGARGGGKHKPREATFYTRVAWRSRRRAHPLLAASRCRSRLAPTYLLSVSVRRWHQAPETRAGSLEARPSFSPSVPVGTRSIRRGRAPACARELAAARCRYATEPFTTAPFGISPCSTYRHSAMSSFRARATIPMRRSRRLPRPNFSSYHCVSALVG
jgi:hypothetical protein